MTKNANNNRGVATIPIILVFGILILAVGVGITAMSFTESISAQGAYQSARALMYAEAGAREALVRVVRNKNYTCASADCYSVNMSAGGCSSNSACARVSVSSGTGAAGNPKVIVSKGQSGASVRSIQVSVVYDAGQNGEIQSATWQELNR